MTDRQLMQQALDALNSPNFGVHSRVILALQERLAHCDRCGKKLGGEGDIHTCTPKADPIGDAQDRLIAEMAAQPEQEPVPENFMDALKFDVAARDAREWERVDMREHAEGNLGIGTAQPAPVQPEQEPETCSTCANSVWPYGSCDVCTVQFDDPTTSNWEPITTPPAAQRTWVGLTDEEWQDLSDRYGMILFGRFKNEIEDKLKEKNNG